MMRRRSKRIWTWLAILLGGASLFQTGGFTTQNGAISSCSRFWTNGISTSVDFCYLLDCRNGFFGGLIQPCGSSTTTADDLLVDCSTIRTTTTTGTNTTGTNTTGTNTTGTTTN